jgi:hypothetical protein
MTSESSQSRLTRFARSDVWDHIISFKIDHGPPYLRRKATQQQRRPKVNFGEIFGFARFSTFATISATNGLMHRSKEALFDHLVGADE